jgi:hypothetical protein
MLEQGDGGAVVVAPDRAVDGLDKVGLSLRSAGSCGEGNRCWPALVALSPAGTRWQGSLLSFRRLGHSPGTKCGHLSIRRGGCNASFRRLGTVTSTRPTPPRASLVPTATGVSPSSSNQLWTRRSAKLRTSKAGFSASSSEQFCPQWGERLPELLPRLANEFTIFARMLPNSCTSTNRRMTFLARDPRLECSFW